MFDHENSATNTAAEKTSTEVRADLADTLGRQRTGILVRLDDASARRHSRVPQARNTNSMMATTLTRTSNT
jgi:hypothetical protein